MTIPVTRSSMPPFEEYAAEIRDLWDSRWLTNMGKKHQQLAAALKDYLNVPDITLFANGHLALEYAINFFALEGEVITTPFTFASTTHAIVRSGLKPVFCDINAADYTIDVHKIESLITENTCAIMPVHVYGNICNLAVIESVAARYHLKVIYDAAHAFGVMVNGTGIGSFGDISMFSFHAAKVFNTIEGGALTFKDADLQHRLQAMTNFGITGPESVAYIGGNAKMNEFQAAMGLCNLRHIDDEIRKRGEVAARYMAHLAGTRGLKLPRIQPGVRSNYAYFPVMFEGYKKTRDEVCEELQANGILPRKYFYPLTSGFACYADRFNPDDTPVARDTAARVLTLPLYADLSSADVDRICEIIKG